MSQQVWKLVLFCANAAPAIAASAMSREGSIVTLFEGFVECEVEIGCVEPEDGCEAFDVSM
jgi:hypothetical protein